MIIYSGAELQEFMENGRDKQFPRQRFIKSGLDDYISSKNDGKICCLYGLRRTGKTIRK